MLSFAALLLLAVSPAASAAGDNPLPFGRNSMPSWLKDAMPLPCGLSFGYTRMSDEIDVSNVTFTIGGQALPPGAIAVDNVTHHTGLELARFDAWILPFLNVYAFAATMNGQAPGVHLAVAPIPGLSALPVPSSIDVPYNGHLYGVGVTVAGGYRKVFASYDLNREWVTVNLFTTTVPVLSQTIRTGVRGKLAGKANAAAYVGGFHLSLRDAVLSGQSFIPGLPGGTFSFVARPKSAWNTLVGGTVEVTRTLVITAEGGFGTRKQFTIMPGLRF